ncbi:MAG: GspH/FimT family pseudopilin [Gammaproteobacteria bacterium]|nr:GspH/FimT family pseudopilin [Gammaproteobacteria bacterium]
MKTKTQHGFTIYELLITMLVVGVVLTLGIPNLMEFTQNSRLASAANDLHSSFQLARSEAARAKAPVTICASANPMDANPACGGSFDQGWIIFQDLDGSLTVDGADTVIRRHPAPGNNITITTNGAANYFGFAATGLGRGDVGGNPALQTAVLCDARGHEAAAADYSTARYIVVTPIGRATVVRDFATITAAGGCP